MQWFCLEQLLMNFSLYFSNNNKKLTDDLLTVSVTFTWFYNIEKIVM